VCGRFALYTPQEAVVRLFRLDDAAPLSPRYNIAPTQPVLAVRADEPAGREARMLRWGLVPFWAKDTGIGSRMINARGETIAEKPAFRQAFRRRRCLIPADGFYEWQKVPGGKQPWFISARDEVPLAFAGLWERWDNRGTEDPVESCTIVTTAANATLAPLHDRMPVILGADAWDSWLAADTPSATLLDMLRPAANDLLAARPVSRRVNSPANDGPDLVSEASA
jgi:putative SOS response-associated peptidase YedK